MPELPEIETIRQDLIPLVTRHTVQRMNVYDRRLLSTKEENRWKTHLLGKTWENIDRKGKYLVVKLAGGWHLVIHLRMTGQLVYVPSSWSYQPGARLSMQFEDGSTLVLFD